MKKFDLFNFSSLIMFLLIIILSINVFNKSIYIDISKEEIANFFNYTFNFKNFFNNNYKNNLVNNDVKYIEEDNKYISSTNVIISLYDGVIICANNNKIKIFQNNDYLVFFEGNFSLFVHNNDYVEKGSFIAEYSEPFSLYFNKDGVNYSYEEYLTFTI